MFALASRIVGEWVCFWLAFGTPQRDESSCANTSAEKDTRTSMTHTETPDGAARVAAAGAPVAPDQASGKHGASQKKGASRRQKTAAGGRRKAAAKRKPKGAKASKPARANKAAAPRAESKGAQILALIGRSKGATLAEIQAYASHCTSLA